MTLDGDRGVGRPTVCPFVAFADERDLRADQPDHRHRCYAEPRPAPRALAHQARFCLSPGFTSCPTFQDWAIREAARVSDTPFAAVGPHQGSAELFEGEAGQEPGLEPVPAPFPPAPATMGAAASVPLTDQFAPGPDDLPEDREPGDDDPVGDAGFAARGRGAPDWDRPRPRRDYPRLERSSRVPRVLVGLVVLAAAAVLLFLLPSLITGIFGGHEAVASPTPTGSAAASGAGSPSASTTPAGPTAQPSPSPLTYVVAKGDTLTRIANKFKVTVPAILAANPAIKNPNTIAVGQVIVIPTAGASASP